MPFIKLELSMAVGVSCQSYCQRTKEYTPSGKLSLLRFMQAGEKIEDWADSN